MKYLGKITDSNDLTNKKYVDDKVGEVNNSLTTLTGRVDTAEDNIQMAESDIGDLQTETGTLKTDMTTVKGAVKTLQDTYVPNTTKVNGKALSGDITLTATDVNALPSTTTIPTKTSQLTNDSDYITANEAPVRSVNGERGDISIPAVEYEDQILDSNQRLIVRTNIGAGNTNTYKTKALFVPLSSWVANTNTQASTEEKQDYPFMATVSIDSTTVETTDIARVMFGYAEQASGNYSLNCYTVANGVIIQAKEKPSGAITLDYILIERILT